MIVLLCPMSDPGFLYPALAIGRELGNRGHTVHAVGGAKAGAAVAEAGFPLLTAEDYGETGAFAVARWFVEAQSQRRAIARAAREVRADVLVTSVLCQGALLAAELLDLPVIVVGLAAYLWDYPAGADGEPVKPASRAWRTRDMAERYGQEREQAGLAWRPARDGYPLLGDAFLLRGDPALEYPGASLPAKVHYTGPCEWEPAADPAGLEPVLARLEQVGKPVVYVHLGRYFGGISPWPRLNAMFSDGPFQAVIERGRSRNPRPAAGPDYLIVAKPWMGPLIDQAGLVLSSGTSAPVLAALRRGLPLGLSPDGAEQPLLTQACVRLGAAVQIPAEVTPDPHAALLAAWHDQTLRERAREAGRRLAASDGPAHAASILEQVVLSRSSCASISASVPGLAGQARPGRQATAAVAG